MIVLLALAAWVLLIVLVVGLCVSAQRGDTGEQAIARRRAGQGRIAARSARTHMRRVPTARTNASRKAQRGATA
jgi:hypothetical protein